MRANADTGEDAARARRLGAQGIGLCRTEHMFLGDRRVLIERLILADSAATRSAALEALTPMQRADFVELFEAMDGLPVTIRLLDPPLHEFLPDRTELSVRVAVARERGEDTAADEKLLAAVERPPTPRSRHACGRPAPSSSARRTSRSGRDFRGFAFDKLRLGRARRSDAQSLRARQEPVRL